MTYAKQITYIQQVREIVSFLETNMGRGDFFQRAQDEQALAKYRAILAAQRTVAVQRTI